MKEHTFVHILTVGPLSDPAIPHIISGVYSDKKKAIEAAEVLMKHDKSFIPHKHTLRWENEKHFVNISSTLVQ